MNISNIDREQILVEHLKGFSNLQNTELSNIQKVVASIGKSICSPITKEQSDMIPSYLQQLIPLQQIYAIKSMQDLITEVETISKTDGTDREGSLKVCKLINAMIYLLARRNIPNRYQKEIARAAFTNVLDGRMLFQINLLELGQFPQIGGIGVDLL